MNPRLLIPTFCLLAAALSGCEAPPELTHYHGTWSAVDEAESGTLQCAVEKKSHDHWEATFTATYAERRTEHEIAMHGRLAGDHVVFAGLVDLGEEGGGRYDWTGRMDGRRFNGTYRSGSGRRGRFDMIMKREDAE